MIIISRKKGVNLLSSYLAKHEYIRIQDIESIFHISKRSAFYWINDLDDQLATMHLEGLQQLSQGKYYLLEETKTALLAHYDNLEQTDTTITCPDKSSRLAAMTWLLIEKRQNITLNGLARYFKVSKNTIITDLQQLRQDLPTGFSLHNSPKGKYLTGDETKQRFWLYEQVSRQTNALIMRGIHGAHYRFLQDRLPDLQKATNVVFSDNALEFLATFLSWTLKRIQLHPECRLGTHPYAKNDGEPAVDNWTITLFQRYEVPVSDEELAFFRAMVYSAQTHNIPNWKFNKSLPIEDLVDQVMTRFSRISGENVNSDMLRNGLIAHLTSTYERVSLGIPFRAPNLAAIQKDYSELMALTSYAIRPFEKYLHKPLPNDELALITTYFGGQTKYLQNTQKISAQFDVLLICSSGIGTSYFLQQTLHGRYAQVRFSHPMDLNDFREVGSLINVKLIISTIALPHKPEIPALVVHGIPTDHDFAAIDKALHQAGLITTLNAEQLTNDVMDILANEVKITDPGRLTQKLNHYFMTQAAPTTHLKTGLPGQRPSIKDLLTPDNIHTTSRTLTWSQAVQRAFLPLLKKDAVTEGYVTEITNKLALNGPFMIVKPGVLLAHSAPSAKVHRLSMSLLKLDHPITFDDEQIDVVIGLAPKGEKQHLRALSGLLGILQDPKQYHTLRYARNKQELVDLIQNI